MNKEKFISELKKRLKRLPKEEVDNIIGYYLDYFDDADKNEDEVLKELGSPSTIASQILADYALDETEERNSNGYINKIIFIILAVFAAPIAFPAGIAVIVMIFALIILCMAMLLTFGAVVIALIFAGIGLFIGGAAVLISRPQTGIFYIGISLLAVGMSMMIGIGIKKIYPMIAIGFKNIIRKLLLKLQGKSIERRKR